MIDCNVISSSRFRVVITFFHPGSSTCILTALRNKLCDKHGDNGKLSPFDHFSRLLIFPLLQTGGEKYKIKINPRAIYHIFP